MGLIEEVTRSPAIPLDLQMKCLKIREKITHRMFLSSFRAGDRMAVPPCGWRGPYVIVYGEPGRPLINSVRNPLEVTAATDMQARPNAVYYITKVFIPVLNRCAHC